MPAVSEKAEAPSVARGRGLDRNRPGRIGRRKLRRGFQTPAPDPVEGEILDPAAQDIDPPPGFLADGERNFDRPLEVEAVAAVDLDVGQVEIRPGEKILGKDEIRSFLDLDLEAGRAETAIPFLKLILRTTFPSWPRANRRGAIPASTLIRSSAAARKIPPVRTRAAAAIARYPDFLIREAPAGQFKSPMRPCQSRLCKTGAASI